MLPLPTSFANSIALFRKYENINKAPTVCNSICRSAGFNNRGHCLGQAAGHLCCCRGAAHKGHCRLNYKEEKRWLSLKMSAIRNGRKKIKNTPVTSRGAQRQEVLSATVPLLRTWTS
ncbi:hypothetical protein ABC2807 [Shouchella clausii KSM-K16]|uniref:Uncharacterized protein n=1 Tax=Shouchella clausii (strain KSM-K16) TaxID=66692 RepID=Q5WE69_SHOC1|nr:hypothetical protein ABC2807 [Shouchella clausii KSM-K16]